MSLPDFEAVQAFHGCQCPDIALGYRVAQALIREFGLDPEATKNVVAELGQTSCAADAIQFMCGCTTGKRNLVYTDSGKASYSLREMSSGRAVRVYVNYWEKFDQEAFRQLKRRAKRTASDQQAYSQRLDELVQYLLTAPESDLFSLRHDQLAPLEKSAGFETAACAKCGEFTRLDCLTQRGEQQLCCECLN